ncbi:MAG: hypothetical protein ACI93R_001602 [Flavobacteriales bacterium]
MVQGSKFTQALDSASGVDFIGDVHGCANSLRSLLEKMDYVNDSGVYRHKTRIAFFVGDIVDRGPRIREALHLIKSMVDAGTACCVLGNHEYNALAYTTPISENDGETQYMRQHNHRNNRLISETLSQFAGYPEQWRDMLCWFKTLPLYYEHKDFRVVHACWDDKNIQYFESHCTSSNACVDDYVLGRIAGGDKDLAKAVDRLTHGTYFALPEGRAISGKDGLVRTFFRTKFWAKNPKIYRDLIFQPDPLPEDLDAQRLDETELNDMLSYPDFEKPVFIGHYWLNGKPKIQRENVACLDYSAVKYGRLVCYRYDGESKLHNDKFEWVYVDPN